MNQYIEAILIFQFLGKKELGAVTIEVDEQEYPLHDLPTSFELDLPLGVNMSDHMDVYKAVVSQRQQLVKCGEYIKLCNEVKLY